MRKGKSMLTDGAVEQRKAICKVPQCRREVPPEEVAKGRIICSGHQNEGIWLGNLGSPKEGSHVSQ